MIKRSQTREETPKRHRRDLLFLLLLLPLLCGLVFCASHFGLAFTNTDSLNVTIEAFASAQYDPWATTAYSPVDPIIGTFVAIDSGDFEGNFTVPERPTLVALLATASAESQSNEPQQDSQPSEQQAASTARAITQAAAIEAAANASATVTTATPSISPTASITPTASISPAQTATPTVTPSPSASVTATATNTPTRTPTPSNTPIAPVAAFTANPASGSAPLTVSFTNSSSGPIVSYSWNFGDSTTSTAVSPTHVYVNPGSYTVTLTVFSATASDSTSATVVVSNVNAPPVNGVPGSQSTNENTPLTIGGISVSDPDAGGAVIQMGLSVNNGTVMLNSTAGISITGGANGSGSVTINGTIASINNAVNGLRYAPNFNFSGGDTLTITSNDLGNSGAGGPRSDQDTVAITVNNLNAPPVAVNDAFVTNQNTLLNVPAAGVLNNDSDPDSDPISVTSADNTSAQGGSVSVNANGSFSYTPAAGFNGGDSFNYTIGDGNGGFNSAQVFITVNAVNTPPIARNNFYNTDKDIPLNVSAPGVLGNDTDADLDPLTVTAADSTSNQGGSVAVNGDGSFTYTPPTGFSGFDRFTYTAGDGNGGFDNAQVFITVNNVNTPPLANDDSFMTDQDTLLNVSAPGVLGNDTDANLDPLTVTAFDSTSAQNGTVSANADGSFSYDPPAGYAGLDTFNYTISDGNGGSDSALVTITVSPPNVAPVANNDAYTVNQNTVLNVPASGVLGNDTDADLDPLTVTGADTTSAQLGTVAVNADGSFTYTPLAIYFGADSFNYTISDGNGGSDSAVVNITVNAVPVAVPDAYITDEDTPLNVPANGVLGNDIDADFDPLTVTGADAASVQGGSVTVNADGSLSYTPLAGYFGPDSFTYTVGDGNGGSAVGTVTITVNLVNVAPVANNDAYVTDENTTLIVSASGVLGNDTDADFDPLTVTGADATSVQGGSVTVNADGSFTYNPLAGYFGPDSFGYTTGDGFGGFDNAVVNITVNQVNSPPVANDDAYVTDEDTPLNVPASGVLGNDTDADFDALTVTAFDATSVQGGGVTVNADGSFTYNPFAGYFGPDSFGYTIGDGNGGSDSAVVNITVNKVNTPPVANDDAYSTTMNTSLNVNPASGVVSNDTDADLDPLTVTAHDSTSAQNGLVNVNPQGAFSYNPPTGFTGTDTFTYTVSDGNGGTAVGTVTITVNP